MANDRREAEYLKRIASFRAAGELERRYHTLGIGAVAAAAAHVSRTSGRDRSGTGADQSWLHISGQPIT
ncbi:MAG: hypothetical protein ACTSSQ_00180 [Alphaproteobacteria bacterium]